MERDEIVNPKFPHHEESDVDVVTVCDKQSHPNEVVKLPKEYIADIKEIVKPYLPGMESVEVLVSLFNNPCKGEGHRCPTSEGQGGEAKNLTSERYVVTLHGEVINEKVVHRHYARATIDKGGKILKLVVSR